MIMDAETVFLKRIKSFGVIIFGDFGKADGFFKSFSEQASMAGQRKEILRKDKRYKGMNGNSAVYTGSRRP